VLTISGIVILLLVGFARDVIREERVDATMQAMENTALFIDNTLRLMEMTARLEQKELHINRSRIERIIEENGLQNKIRQRIPHAQLYVARRDSSQFDAFLTGKTSGYRKMSYENQEIYIFLQPLGNRIYNLAATCPSKDIHKQDANMQRVLFSWSIVTILILLIVLYYIIDYHLHPLHTLADSAQAIANGHLDTPIGDTHHPDETGRLQNSLLMMQRKMVAYMGEMRQKQSTLNRQNAELQLAYEEARMYEERKAKFIHNMTNRMTAPVGLLCRSTETICRDYQGLSKDDMTTLQTNITQGCETIIELLDQLIKDPSGS
jgi:nitrate/nitrite-specific signal transduction histidine kinase